MDDSWLIQKLNKSTRLGGIEYKIAETSADFKLCHNLATKRGLDKSSFHHPTVMALEDNNLIGFISTYTVGDMVAIGPLVLDNSKPRRLVALRLIEAIDSVMQVFGIEWYIFYVDKGSPLVQMAEKLGMEQYAERDGKCYFLRTITDGTDRDRSPVSDEGGAEAQEPAVEAS